MRKFLDAGRQAGFREADLRRLRLESVEWQGGAGEAVTFRRGTSHTVALRGFRDHGFPVGGCVSMPTLKEVRRVYRELQRVGVTGTGTGFSDLLPDAARKVPLSIHDPRISEAESLGEEMDSRISELMIRQSGIELAGWRLRAEERKVNVANTRGLEAKYRKTLFSLTLRLRDGDREVEVEEQRTHWLQLQPDRLLGRAVFLLGPRSGRNPPRWRSVGLVLSPFASASVLRDFAAALRVSGEYSPGDIRCAPQVQIIDSPLVDGMPGSVPMDDEGVMARETPLVEGGRFKARVTDLAGAAREGCPITGNGFRGIADPFPRAGFTNLCIRPSVISLERMLKETGRGILITRLRLRGASGTDRTYGAEGYLFKGTELGEPVRFALRTAFLSYFLKIDRVSRESVPTVSGGISVISPYLRVEALRRGDEWVV